MKRRAFLGSATTAAVLALAALAALLGCGGGGGGGGGPTQPPPPMPGIVFTPAGMAGTNAIRLASGAGSTVTVLELEVRAESVQDLYGVSFDLAYPQQLLRYDGATEGTLLSQGGTATSLLTAPSAGNLVVGLSRLGRVAGVSGSGVVLTLRFTAIGTGNGAFTFARNSAASSTGASSGATWTAGSVQVTL